MSIGLAVFPTTEGNAPATLIPAIHYGSAAVLFLILTRFCFVFFQVDIKGKDGKKVAEAIALCAFGAARIVAGKYLSILTEPEEKLTLLEPKNEITK